MLSMCGVGSRVGEVMWAVTLAGTETTKHMCVGLTGKRDENERWLVGKGRLSFLQHVRCFIDATGVLS